MQLGEPRVASDGGISLGNSWADQDCGVSAPYVCGFCSDVPQPPPPPAPPPRPAPREVLVPRCAKRGRPEQWGIVDDLWIDDGSGPAGEATTIQLCWTSGYLSIQATVIDSEIVSNQPNCGDSTWNGDSIETFIAPGSANPTAWMETDVSAAGGMYMAAISGNGDSYGSAEALSQSGAGQCDIRGIEYAAQMTNTGYVVNLQLPWHHFVNMDQFADELAAYREFPPRVWRANFYRTNFFNSGQRNPQDFYAWNPTVANGQGASFHKPNEFGTMRLVDAPPGGGH